MSGFNICKVLRGRHLQAGLWRQFAAGTLAAVLLSTASSAIPASAEAQPSSAVSTLNRLPSVKDNSTKRPRVGLALGGGGTRGLAHVGVLRVLEREGIPIDYISGTSMGAIVGGLYSAGLSVDQIEKLFRDKSMIRAFDTVPIPVRVALIPIFFIPHLFGWHPYDGLYRGNKFAHYLNDVVPPGRRNLEDLPIPFQAVASNLLDGRAHVIKTGNFGRALQCSSAIPALRRPVEWQGGLYVDGGIVNNLPVDECRKMGADIVIAVDVDEKLENVPPETFRKIGSVPSRCIDMHLAVIDDAQAKNADIVIQPDVSGISLLSRKVPDMDRAVANGESAAKEALGRIHTAMMRKLQDLAKQEKPKTQVLESIESTKQELDVPKEASDDGKS